MPPQRELNSISSPLFGGFQQLLRWLRRYLAVTFFFVAVVSGAVVYELMRHDTSFVSFLLRNHDFLQSCASHKTIETRISCIAQWFRAHPRDTQLEKAMAVVDKRLYAGVIGINTCHQWKDAATHAWLSVAEPDVESALAACGENRSCDGACTHSIMAWALEKFGSNDETIRMLGDACARLSSPWSVRECMHGMGHQFARELSGSFTLHDALGVCDKAIFEEEARKRCYRGLFQELIWRGRRHETEDLAALYIRPSDPLFPCETIAEQYREQCYGEAPGRTFFAVGSSVSVMDTCARIAQATWARACRSAVYEGIAKSDRFPQEKQRACAGLGEFASQCSKTVAGLLATVEGFTKDELRAFCEALTDQPQPEVCRAALTR